MKKSEKTENVVRVFNLLKDAKYSKMADNDKVAVWKVFRAIKKVSMEYISDVEDARQSLMPYETFMDDLQKAREYEVARNKKENYDGMTKEAYDAFIEEFVKYNALVKKAVKECSDKAVDVEFEPLSNEAFDKLCLSNDWTFDQTDEVQLFVCE